MNHENRVLGRMGTRELTPAEVERAIGGIVLHTNVCSISLSTGAVDGDGCSGNPNNL